MKPTIIDRVWAEDASAAAITEVSAVKFAIGFEAEIPAYQELNRILNTMTGGFSYVNRQGLFEWDSETTYPIGGICLYDGVRWQAKQSTLDVIPTPGDDWTLSDGKSVGDLILFDANTPATIDGISVSFGSAGAWVDNVTKPGWYACIPTNSAFGVPNLVSEFIKATSPGSDGVFDGSKEVTFTSDEMPSHEHSGNIELTDEGSEHSHNYKRATSLGFTNDGNSTTGTQTIPDSGQGVETGPGGTAAGQMGLKVFSADTLMGSGEEHEHTISPNIDSFGGGVAMTINLKAYSAIFIMKVY